jgi:molecular chaperone GrpE
MAGAKKKSSPKKDPTSSADKRSGENDATWEPEPLFDANGTGDSVNIVDSLQGQVENLRKQLSRATQEFQNHRKRSEEDRTRTLLYATEAMILDLLPILDDFDRAISHMDEEADPGEVFDGMKMIRQRLGKMLEKQGVNRIIVLGERFDPFLHEAVHVQETEGAEPGEVVEEFQAGYQYETKLVRATQVVINPLAINSNNNKDDKKPAPPVVDVPAEQELDDDELTAEVGSDEYAESEVDDDSNEQDEEFSDVPLDQVAEEAVESLLGEDDEKTTVTPSLEESESAWEMDEISLDVDSDDPL